MKSYHGRRHGGNTVRVYGDDGSIEDLAGGKFDWGASNAGAKHLAEALLKDATGDKKLAHKLASQFADEVVAQLSDAWGPLSESDVCSWVTSKGVMLPEGESEDDAGADVEHSEPEPEAEDDASADDSGGHGKVRRKK